MAPQSASAITDPEPAVVVDGLHKRFGKKPAVVDASLSVHHSSVTALLGPNGAGKTTTLETIAGLQSADTGRVRVLGVDPWHSSANHRARVGVMLQGGGIWSTATARQAVENVARFYRYPLNPKDLLETLQLSSQQTTTPYRRLSGGEQQRVKLACAIVGRPQLAILDEPSSGLDPATRIEIWGLIRGLQKNGTTVLLSTHSMEEAEALADHVVIMSDGRVALAGDPATLTQSRGQQCLWFCTDSDISSEALLSALPEGHTLFEQSPGRYRLEGVTVTPETIATVTSWCAKQGIMTTDLKVRDRSLEDVFLEVTAK